MATRWPTTELDQIVKADDLKIAPLRKNRVSYGTPTWIWCVAVDGDLYVRAYSGRRSSWYQAAVEQRAGRIAAAGMIRDVEFEPVEGSMNERIDEAYRTKYSGSPYLKPMVSPQARAATVRVTPSSARP